MKNRFGRAILNLLFPARCPWCGRVMGFKEECFCDVTLQQLRLPDTPLNLAAEGQNGEYLQAVWACYKYTVPVNGAILRMKFGEDLMPAESLGKLMVGKFNAAHLAGCFDIAVPVPVSQKTLRRRGYNQSAVLARHLAGQTGLLVVEEALEKAVETPRQMSLGRQERRANVAGAYKAPQPALVYGRRILLVDDVITTGSTLNECARVLLEAGAASCSALCLASTGREHVLEKQR